MYRPTVRYADVFKNYVDELFKATHLDRNQIIRAALFAAAHSKEFQDLLKPYQKKDVPLPSPAWRYDEHRYWMEQQPDIKERGKDVNVKHGGKNEGFETSLGVVRDGRREKETIGRIEPTKRRTREISSERTIRNQGGITIKIN